MTCAIISALIITKSAMCSPKKSSVIYRTLRFGQYLHGSTAKCLIVLPVEAQGPLPLISRRTGLGCKCRAKGNGTRIVFFWEPNDSSLSHNSHYPLQLLNPRILNTSRESQQTGKRLVCHHDWGTENSTVSTIIQSHSCSVTGTALNQIRLKNMQK